ncbi:MAG TPA: glycoside hydrolase TIM-barrel-like domain-containing protein [Paracoccus sp. (in: a-proteobacteria)]|uniref:baseplate multidomain protein megatron n=1 Tax=uncultured Paracoccus sp. TaxID=189685 RepID=UPI002631E676|nr:glycoside hydrolase TIM-barrel-like domain-containing protein [uncultured Paracoccus sp.]HMQ42012.1 glycoside hydrolase TIM-barrel-like domain-containing protein [Paracoccus sp. (in: a-proteobacteria)]HMR35437.1 glycoside hydrolase TIM-barrel-like domain-containing protein [Paracoccus sp. (in: a-proteobacteria)]
MATILLSAVGAAVGSGFGGTVLGLTGAVIGRAIGATAGRLIDQRLLGAGSQAVETGRIDRLRIQTTGEGIPIPRLWGQMRVPGHVIWAAPLTEVSSRQGGGKGTAPRVTNISYRLSLALALCEGPILGVGRVWADGEEIPPSDLNMRVYDGSETQLPDPCITAHEGEDTPAYRGIAYVVLEEQDLERWGNRLPQLSFEVTRAAKSGGGLSREVQAVAMIPGTGEYSLATRAVSYDLGWGETVPANSATALAETDFAASMDILGRELPRVGSVSLVVSWFGDDLRVGHCTLRPKVEDAGRDGQGMAWRAGGIGRAAAMEVARKDDRPIYGGTPADASVIEALRAIAQSGRKAVFYPFILMEQLAGNGRPDPWTGAVDQPIMPWRGRITAEIAPGRDGSPDGTAANLAAVRAFFGDAAREDFAISDGAITYTGPQEWSYRRFILHYAHLCAMAGGVDAFLIGSEMRGLTQLRGPENRFPAVEELRRLAADVRAILGPDAKISYAADWSEYFGHHPGGGDVFFHLDPLWSDPNVDFIGIDNYMPLSDWREGEDHKDAHWRRIDAPGHLESQVAGGEGYDWYYADSAHRESQIRTPIEDGAYGEHWIWRYKDLVNWWGNRHHDRIEGVRQAVSSAWVPRSKPIWFTEMGCAALDKGSNQPNKFLDAMSSESRLPYHSNGARDDAMQAAYVRAMTTYWSDPAHNPMGSYGGHMVDMSRAHVWCWDARPYPAFPGRADLWSDGPAWDRGHWLNGRAGAVPLARVVADICAAAGVTAIDVSRLSGLVRGYSAGGAETARASLQPLMLAYGFDAVERDGVLKFIMRDGLVSAELSEPALAELEEVAHETTRSASAEMVGRLRLTHVAVGGSYATSTVEASLPDDPSPVVSDSEMALLMTVPEARNTAARWLAEAQIGRETVRFRLPPSQRWLGPGDVVALTRRGDKVAHRWRIDRVERAGGITVDAVRTEPGIYRPVDYQEDGIAIPRYQPPMPVWPIIMDLPLMRGNEVPHAPHIAVAAKPWPGSVVVYGSASPDSDFMLNTTLPQGAMIGVTESPLRKAKPGLIDRGHGVLVRFGTGALANASENAVLHGANLVAIGNGSPYGWEIFQFTRASLVASNLWSLGERLRGQFGTDATMPDEWPVGSIVVVLDGALRQLALDPATLGQVRHWRIGPAMRGVDHPSYRQRATNTPGAGLRPLSPCHLRLVGERLSWIRRTRIQGDRWDLRDVPLAEAREAYLILVEAGGETHEFESGAAAFDLPSGLAGQAGQGRLTASVAQLSEQFGPGPFITRSF